MEGRTWMEGSEREDMMVDHEDGRPPKLGGKSPKARGPFEKGNCRFVLLIRQKAYFNQKKTIAILKKIQKALKVGGLTRTEGTKREDMMVDHKDDGPPKVGEKSPKVGGPFE